MNSTPTSMVPPRLLTATEKIAQGIQARMLQADAAKQQALARLRQRLPANLAQMTGGQKIEAVMRAQMEDAWQQGAWQQGGVWQQGAWQLG